MSKKRKLTPFLVTLLAVLCIAAALIANYQNSKADKFSGVMLDGTAELEIMLSGKFTVTNGVGQQFIRENGEFKGDMEYFPIDWIANDPAPPYLMVEVPASSAYCYEPESEEFSFRLSDQWNGFVCFSGENLDRLVISDNEARLEGENLAYHLSYSALGSRDMIFLNGEGDQVRFFWEDGKLYTDGIRGTVTGEILYDASLDSPWEFTLTADSVIDPSNETEPVTLR